MSVDTLDNSPLEYLALAEDTGAETSDARGHLFKLLHGGLTARVDLRTALSTASSLDEMRAVVDALDQADPDGLLEARHDDPTDRKSWYWRHRDPAIVQARLARKLRKSERRNAARRRGGELIQFTYIVQASVRGRSTCFRPTPRRGLRTRFGTSAP